ncbi:MAG TPA: glycosyltransferase family 1 protein [Bacteroidota bacterium]|nr:glycosyltransferase family 1 protein [Bacteroidota bacterium]
MPLIAFDARKYNDFGIGTYIRHLIQEFSIMDSSPDFFLFLNPDAHVEIELPGGWKSSAVRYGKYSIGELLLFGRTVNSSGASLFHSPHYTLPVGIRNNSVVTIHDLIHLRFPQFFSPLQRAYSYGMMYHAIHDSAFVITDSEFTKKDILRSFRVSEEKIVVIHLGVDAAFFRPPPVSFTEEVRTKFNLRRRYILFAGNAKPHKGIPVLLRAFRELSRLYSDVDLVFAGGSANGDTGLQAVGEDHGFEDRVISVGHVSEKELVTLYRSAEMFVLPSLYEGFGLPALEAMACRTPVVVSDAGSLPEVVGDAALVFKSGDSHALSEAMRSLLDQSQLKKELIEKGEKRARHFSWQRTAIKTAEIYRRLL